MKKLLFCLQLLLIGALAVSCTGEGAAADTIPPADTATPIETPTVVPPETPTEEPTTEAETEPAFDPLAFVPTELPVANVAREGYALASACKNDGGYSNLHLNDGDRTTGFSTPWEVNQDPSAAYYFFVDLTTLRRVDHVKLYPLEGDEQGFPKAFDVLVSADGAEYRTAATVTDTSAEAAKDGLLVELGGVEARFVKLVTRELGEGSTRKGRYLALSEFEVYAPIDTASNMILNRDDVWLFKNPDTTQKLEILYYRDGTAVDPEAELRFATLDAGVATVDESGVITPVSIGKTDVYVTDGKHMAVCRVEVKEELRDEFRISAFYHSNFAYPEQIPVGLRILAEGGVEYIEDTRSVDRAGNHISMYSLFVCRELGLAYSPNDPAGSHNFLKMKDEEILDIVKKYENRAGFYGIYLQDEPHEEYLGYARVFHLIQAYNPHLIPHLNLLPPYNFGGIDEYFTEFAAVAGGNGRMRYLTYDHYPFLWGGAFNNQVYSSLNRLRKAGLLYQADTGFYMQSMIIDGGYPLLDADALRYNASLGIAYGMKNYKWFVALTPVDNEAGAFKTGFVTPEFTPAGNYEGLIAAGKYVKTVGTVLGNSDAIEVYHANGETDHPTLPKDFVFTLAKPGDAILTLYESLSGSGQQHVVITNKKFTANGAVTLTLKANRTGEFKLLNLTTGEMEPLTVGADGTFTLDLAPGQCAVIELPADWDVSRPAEASENLAKNKPVYVSSSSATFWEKSNLASYFLTDGDPEVGHWVADRTDRSCTVKLDLTEVCDVSRVVIRMNRFVGTVKALRDFTVLVSEDGVTYTEVAKIDDMDWGDLTEPLELTFDTAKVRYVLIRSDSSRPVGIGEIEVYS